jgi:Holliday junction resolvase-like predicted endonuclease
VLKNTVVLSDRRLNCVRFRLKESYPHRLRKFEVCNWLYNNGYNFYTEAEFTTGGRADIVVWNAATSFIIEVLHSEKIESILKKKEIYPSRDIRIVKTSEQFVPEAIL